MEPIQSGDDTGWLKSGKGANYVGLNGRNGKHGSTLASVRPEGRNKRSVWSINTKPFAEAHFAVYPEALIETPILAGCPIKGVVLDPFFGSGTSGAVAIRLDRHYIGIELNPEYIELAEKRLTQARVEREVELSRLPLGA